MTTYAQMKENYEIIRKFSEMYRKDLTLLAATAGENCGLVSREDYIKFADEMTLDEFVGNQLVGLLNSENIETFRKILDGEMEFREMVSDILSDEIWNEVCRKIES